MVKMMTKFRVLPYRQGSKGAKALATALGGRVLKLEGSTFSPLSSSIIVNWGNVNPPPIIQAQMDAAVLGHPGACRIFNMAGDLKSASNKLKFFNAVKEAGLNVIPRYWTNTQEIPEDAFPIVCRTVLAGHSGEGIVIADTRAALVPAPLYVEYVKKTDEYRIHVGRKSDATLTTIAIQRKARRTDVPDAEVNWRVRNHHNGFNFIRGGVNPPASAIQAASDALGCVGLDFGAVDVIWNEAKARPYVLEVNTAPGLEGQTIADYASFFRSLA